MEFTDQPLEPFGEPILDIAVPTQLSFKQPLVFRIVKELAERGYLPWTGSPRAELCIDEALTNAMLHGNKMDPEKKVTVTVCGDDARWGMIVRDEGGGFSEVDLPDPDDPEALLRESGRGIPLMDGYVDSLRYNMTGNTLLMTRARQAEPEAVEALSAVAGDDAADAPGETAVVEEDGAVRVVVVGLRRVTDENVDDLKEVLAGLVDEEPHLLLDLGRVEYISSVGLAALISLLKKVRAAEGHLILSALQPSVEDILKSAHLLKVFDTAPTRQHGVDAMREKL
jgi:serine/threonine-protein kinase RsbW